MRLRMLVFAAALWLSSQPTYAVTGAEIIQNPQLISEYPQEQVIVSNDLIGRAKIKPDYKIYIWKAKVIGFRNHGSRTELQVVSANTSSPGWGWVAIGYTGNLKFNSAMEKFAENSIQDNSVITVVGVYGSNNGTAPVLTALYLEANGKEFPRRNNNAPSKTATPETEVPVTQPLSETQPQATAEPANEEAPASSVQGENTSSGPCSSGITDDIEACLENKYDEANKQLNATWKKLMGAITDPAKKKELRNWQRQWIKDRDKYCAAPMGDHGSIWRFKPLECLTFWVDYRNDQLEAMFDDIEN